MSEPLPAPPRALTWAQFAIATIGALVTVGGVLLATGGTLQRITTLEHQMVEVRENQSKYIPVLVGMQADMKYLADRARRQDERDDRERR